MWRGSLFGYPRTQPWSGRLEQGCPAIDIRAGSLSGASPRPSIGKADHLVESLSHRIHKDTAEGTLVKPHRESQFSRYPDGKGPPLLA